MPGRIMDCIWKDGILLSPGRVLPGDRIYQGMRIWDPRRSKVAALFHLEKALPIPDTRILYLGAAAGTTVSFLADYAEVVYAVEFSYRPVRTLLRVALERSNIIPFYQDARYPERYSPFIELVDILIQDIAQRDQAGIAVKNLCLLKEGGCFVLFLKLFSMGAISRKDEFIKTVLCMLEENGIEDLEVFSLEQYHAGHVAVCGRYESKTE